MLPLGSPLFHSLLNGVFNSPFLFFWEHVACSCCLLLVYWEKFVCELKVKQRLISYKKKQKKTKQKQ